MTILNRAGMLAWLAASLLPAAGCAPAGHGIPAPRRIVFITIDCLRADHLPSFGYPLETAPFLESLAASGTSFKRAFTHSATTGPSHASMFTSLYPIQHRVQTNGHVLDPSFVTLAEVVDGLGYATAGLVSGMSQFGESGIAQGFRVYDEPEMSTNDKGKPMLNRPASETTDAAIGWLDRVGPDEPFLLWVHYYDLHNPLRPPQRFVERSTPQSPEDQQRFREFLEREHRLAPRKGARLGAIHKYDAGLMYVDEEIRRLYETLAERGLDSKALWVVTSDHGQGLGNHDWWGHHKQIYNVQLHVPLIFHFTGGSPAVGEIDDQLVELVDFPATILDLLGAEMQGQPGELQGRSLAPLLAGRRGYTHREFVFGERRRALLGDKQRSVEPGERYALQNLEQKYLLFSEGPDEFYDLANDPYETVNLIDRRTPEMERMLRELERLVMRLESDLDPAIVDDETLERLKAQGYLE